jgi:hypothetical protein
VPDEEALLLPVNLTTWGHIYDDHENFFLADLINDPILAHSEAPGRWVEG